MTGDDTVIEFSEPLALAGLEEQWEKGDRFALIEAIALCSENGWDYPEWVIDLVNAAAKSVYQSAYPGHDLDRETFRVENSNVIPVTVENLSGRLEASRSAFLSVFGLSIAKDNAIKVRDRLLRDAYLAEEVARRCVFHPGEPTSFGGVNRAIDDIALIVADGSDRQEKRSFQSVCHGASSDMITRAWRKHHEAIAQFFSAHPDNASVPLAWFFFEIDPAD